MIKSLNSFKNVSKIIKSKLVFFQFRIMSTIDSQFHSTNPKVNESKEVKVAVPWGNIAGKWYGPENVRPILLLHGWQDNAGTFDHLIPLLPQQFSYLAIDLPGHGQSSHLPPGMIYSMMNYIQTINHIQRNYKWDKLSFCSHSLGAIISQLYASLYPDRCDLLISLDGMLKPFSYPVEILIEHACRIGDDFLVLDQLHQSGKEPPSHTHEEIVERWSKVSGLPSQALEGLIKRGVCPSKNYPSRFYFSRDIRLKIMHYGSNMIQDQVHYKLMQRIKAPFFFINANRTGEFVGIERYQKSLDILTDANPKFQYITIAGDHHCHLSNPTLVSQHISNFLNKYHFLCKM